MTARNYCIAGDNCDHRTKAAKSQAHGTPEEFEKSVWRTVANGFVTREEATQTIARYRKEYEASPEDVE